MSGYILAPDYTTLPQALMPLLKAHLRIDFDDDDTLLIEYAAQATAILEQVWGFQVFGGMLTWEPDGGQTKYQCPYVPVTGFTATVIEDATDVTGDYIVEAGTLVDPWYLVRNDGEVFPDGLRFEMAVGYSSTASLYPQMRSGILRLAATFYEHAESVSVINPDVMPNWVADVINGLWVPRA